MYIPDHASGFAAQACEGIQPAVLTEVTLETIGFGIASIRVLKWDIKDFLITEVDLSDGYFITYEVTIGDQQFNLSQHLSVFFTSEQVDTIRQVDSPKKPKGFSGAWPQWHKCDRFWPAHENELFEFIGQFYYSDSVAYLFVRSTYGEAEYAIYSDELNRQDREEHYRDEA